jgi:hypothetical protein
VERGIRSLMSKALTSRFSNLCSQASSDSKTSGVSPLGVCQSDQVWEGKAGPSFIWDWLQHWWHIQCDQATGSTVRRLALDVFGNGRCLLALGSIDRRSRMIHQPPQKHACIQEMINEGVMEQGPRGGIIKGRGCGD